MTDRNLATGLCLLYSRENVATCTCMVVGLVPDRLCHSASASLNFAARAHAAHQIFFSRQVVRSTSSLSNMQAIHLYSSIGVESESCRRHSRAVRCLGDTTASDMRRTPRPRSRLPPIPVTTATTTSPIPKGLGSFRAQNHNPWGLRIAMESRSVNR